MSSHEGAWLQLSWEVLGAAVLDHSEVGVLDCLFWGCIFIDLDIRPHSIEHDTT